jgi:DNA-binding IclR family transcriptional regulator
VKYAPPNRLSEMAGSPAPRLPHDLTRVAGVLPVADEPERRSRATGRPMVRPFARALALLSVFTPKERGLTNRELAVRSDLPASTVTRIAKSLVHLGYLHYSAVEHRYCLSASVLALGYGGIANSGVQKSARIHLRAFADQHKLHVNLSTRDRLDLIVLHGYSGPQSPIELNLHAGVRVAIASSPLGWALLAALPEVERYYLLENIERRTPRDWPRVRRRLTEAMAQVHETGFCTSLGEWDQDLGIAAVPLLIDGNAPLVLACVGSSSQMTRPRVNREFGPRLLAAAAAVRREGDHK